MFENYTFEYLMQSCLNNVSDKLDKREGSVIYDALAPACMELSNAYMMLDMVLDESFADTASYYYLIKRASEKGIYPEPETYAVLKMRVTPSDIVISTGDRFAMDDMNYIVLSAVEGETGVYEIQCETVGTAGNANTSGTLLPIEYIEGLESAELEGIIIPGQDEEDVEIFRERYLTSFDLEAFGGNKADYKAKVNAIEGVGDCKILRAWENGYNPANFIPQKDVNEWISNQNTSTVGDNVYSWLNAVYQAAKKKLLTVGGTVKIIIISSDFSQPSSELVHMVQEQIDPVQTTGDGDGIAPIGHIVNVVGVKNYSINFEFNFVFARGYSFESVKSSVEKTIDEYLLSLRRNWANSNIIVRLNQIETEILKIDGIADITSTKMNSNTSNLALDAECIPVRGDVSG